MFWKYLARPLFFKLDAEKAHYATMRQFCRVAPLIPSRYYHVDDERLRTSICGLQFGNPIGLAAGFDKNALWFPQLAKLGFGHVEVGTITALEQPGNDKPRLFRLVKDRALINRMGFNNDGCEKIARHFESRKCKAILGINIGKSKVTPLEEADDDYLTSLRALYRFADYLTINVSSPNTPGLRKLQGREPLLKLLEKIATERDALAQNLEKNPIPVFLKIAPDLNEHELDDVVSIARETRIDGIIATNTTISRDNLNSKPDEVAACGNGGLSGAPLTIRSREVVSYLYRQTEGKIPIIGVGGIMSGDDAWKMIGAGASLVQVYTGFIYGGPGFVKRINQFILKALRDNHFENVSEAIGHNHRTD